VIKSTGSLYTVVGEDGCTYLCKLKGIYRIKGIKATSPVVVGDIVEFDPVDKNSTPMIREILPRENYIIRKATKLSKKSQIIASNIDQAVVVVSLIRPRTSTGFIDRFLVTAEAYHIPAVIVFNKIDLHDIQLHKILDELISIYTNAGYGCLSVSAKSGQNIESFRDALKDKVSLLTGHSGVGKSALINMIQPDLKLRTAAISSVHEKGMHTTTFTEMYPLSFGGFIIDTPGIKEFGLINFNKVEVPERFPEFRRYLHECKFHNCTHLHEPGCAVKEALKKGEISQLRYNSYLSMLTDDYWDNNKYEYSD
ncbi:MAG: ribosome small subunit-dependent GTPase A, partial [Bacteroidales bacterium]|nr:ribosome small subunit-dependent GTPase A [Bacteroidales bacterium]